MTRRTTPSQPCSSGQPAAARSESALIGAGKFGSMLLAQAQRIPGFHVVGVADLDVGKARASLARVGWPAERYSATSLGDAVKTGKTCVLDDASALAACDEIECIVEATGHPIAGVRHALAAIDGGKHLIMVNVEADVLCGPFWRPGPGPEPRLQHGLRRPAGHHLRTGGLGALLRLRTDLSRQGNEFRAALSLFHAGYGLGLLRLDGRRGRQGRLQPENVQLLYRRDQGGDRDGGGRQRTGLDCRTTASRSRRPVF